MEGRWPLRLAPLGDLTMGATLWRLEGQLMATVVAKVTASFTVDGAMTLTEPLAVRVDDEHEGGHPMRSVVGARELAPQLYQVDVLMVGHAHAANGSSHKVNARLALEQRGEWVLNKMVSIYGDRDEAGNAQPFDKLRVSWEKAYGGIGHPENPLGTGFGGATTKAPNIIYADGRETPASFSPIPTTFPARKRLLGATSRKAIHAEVADVPATFDWSYFQAAPFDQRLESLQGNEWLQIEGMHPSQPRIRTRLPGVTVTTKVYEHRALGAPDAIPMRPDMLLLEPNELRACLVYRGSFPVMNASALTKAVIAAGVESPQEPMMWPEQIGEQDVLPCDVPALNVTSGSAPPSGGAHPLQGTFAMSPEAAAQAAAAALPFGSKDTPPPDPPMPPSAPHPLEGTISMTEDSPLGESLPFEGNAPRTAPRAAAPEIPGAPWARTPAKPVTPPAPAATSTANPRTGKPNVRTMALDDEGALAALERIREEDAANEADTHRLAAASLEADTERLNTLDADTERLSAPGFADAGQTADLAAADVEAEVAAARKAAEEYEATQKAAADKEAAEKAAAEKAAAQKVAAEKAAAEEAAAAKAAAEEAERQRLEAETRRQEEAERFRKEQEEAEREAKRRAEEEAKAKRDAAKKLRANMYGGFKRKG